MIKNLLRAYPQAFGVLLERPEVLKQVHIPSDLKDRLSAKAFDLFRPWPESGDAVILARVLHDWDDEHALKILRFAKKTLSADGILYILELLISEESPNGGLLDLNMLVTNNGKERSCKEFEKLLSSAGFVLSEKHMISNIISLLTARMK